MTKRYSGQFKQESIQYAQSHPESGIATIAKQLGVGYSTLASWLVTTVKAWVLLSQHR